MSNTNYVRPVTQADRDLFEQIKADFCTRILAEGAICDLQGVIQKDQHYQLYVVAQGISWTVGFNLPENKQIEQFTVEKTKKKSSCNIM